MKVITLLNEKGGVGKTTMATHVAAGLAAHGHRVMLIDADSQGHATLRVGKKKAPHFYDLMVRDADWNDVSTVVSRELWELPGGVSPESGRLFVVSGNVETRNVAGAIDNVTQLAERLDELRYTEQIDYVVIDTSPTASLLHASIYLATDGIVFPTALAFTSFDGLVEGISHKVGADKGRARYSIPAIDVIGIVPMMTRLHTNEQADNLVKLKQQFGSLVWDGLPMRTLWTETESRALPVWQLDSRSEATTEFWSVFKQLEGVLNVSA